MAKAPSPDSNDEPKTWFEWERRKVSQPELKDLNDALPPLPASSPWGSGPQPGDELPIDRTEDAATGGPNILEVDQ
jgi:hypothetical protein